MNRSRAFSRTRFAIGGAVILAGAALLVGSRSTAAQADDHQAAALPTPKDFVSGLDLECFATQGPALNATLTLTHLNPVLLQLGLPPHNVVARALVETCVPVAKNGVLPSSTALPFIQHVDLACYKLDPTSTTVNPVINLRHLNPVLQQLGLPPHNVRMVSPDTLCVPVIKNNVAPPPEVLAFVRFLDLECWNVVEDPHPTFGLSLEQLNPQLQNIPRHPATLVSTPRKLCVPVRKNQQAIPADALNILRWVDLERFTMSPTVAVAPVPVVLRHINPLFSTLAPFTVVLERAQALMVPVSKNGATPP
jgi:hypothetical protein